MFDIEQIKPGTLVLVDFYNHKERCLILSINDKVCIDNSRWQLICNVLWLKNLKIGKQPLQSNLDEVISK